MSSRKRMWEMFRRVGVVVSRFSWARRRRSRPNEESSRGERPSMAKVAAAMWRPRLSGVTTGLFH